jgi:hypothetical protein
LGIPHLVIYKNIYNLFIGMTFIGKIHIVCFALNILRREITAPKKNLGDLCVIASLKI